MKKLISLTVLALVLTTSVWAQQMNVSEPGKTQSAQSEISTTAPFVCGESKIADYDGNTYNTVQIGKQCWMKENLKTTHYSDGTYIEEATDLEMYHQYRFYPNLNPKFVENFGLLYNWTAVTRDWVTVNREKPVSSNLNPSGIQGICPTGWHVPSDAEWTELTDYLSSNSQYTCDTKSQHTSLESEQKNIAKALAATIGWESSDNKCAIGYKMEENDASGFSALPAGVYTGLMNSDDFGRTATFWTCTQEDIGGATLRSLRFDREYISGKSGATRKILGCSVRCVKD